MIRMPLFNAFQIFYNCKKKENVKFFRLWRRWRLLLLSVMKTFEGLFAELEGKAASGDPNSGTVRELEQGKHFIGKKVLEEAGEVWLAAEHEGKEKTAEEISQLIYHVQVMMIANDLKLEDVYRYL